ncbi:hypothetical protein MRB53_039820 [Persea americana]|nr:hypothetical protein MRB53_039820 [Persea americana]
MRHCQCVMIARIPYHGSPWPFQCSDLHGFSRRSIARSRYPGMSQSSPLKGKDKASHAVSKPKKRKHAEAGGLLAPGSEVQSERPSKKKKKHQDPQHSAPQPEVSLSSGQSGVNGTGSKPKKSKKDKKQKSATTADDLDADVRPLEGSHLPDPPSTFYGTEHNHEAVDEQIAKKQKKKRRKETQQTLRVDLGMHYATQTLGARHFSIPNTNDVVLPPSRSYIAKAPLQGLCAQHLSPSFSHTTRRSKAIRQRAVGKSRRRHPVQSLQRQHRATTPAVVLALAARARCRGTVSGRTTGSRNHDEEDGGFVDEDGTAIADKPLRFRILDLESVPSAGHGSADRGIMSIEGSMLTMEEQQQQAVESQPV